MNGTPFHSFPKNTNAVREAAIALPRTALDETERTKIADSKTAVSDALERSFQSTGARRFSTPAKHLRELNEKAAESADGRNRAGKRCATSKYFFFQIDIKTVKVTIAGFWLISDICVFILSDP